MSDLKSFWADLRKFLKSPNIPVHTYPRELFFPLFSFGVYTTYAVVLDLSTGNAIFNLFTSKFPAQH
jgi:hypothetical protein